MIPYNKKRSICVTHIHVHPDVVLFADVGNGDERVKGSVHRRSRCGTDKERYKTLQRHRQKGWFHTQEKKKSICGIYSCVMNAYLLFGFHYSPLKVSWNHFTTAKEKQDFVAVVAEILQWGSLLKVILKCVYGSYARNVLKERTKVKNFIRAKCLLY